MADIKSPLKVFKPIDITDDVLYSSSIAEPDTSTGEVEWVDPKIAQSLGSYSESDSNYTITGMVNYGGYVYAITTTTDWATGAYNSYVIKVNESTGATSSVSLGYEFSCVDVALNGSGFICFVGRSTINSYTHVVYDTSDDTFVLNGSGAGSLFCVTSIDGDSFDAFGSDGYYVSIETDATTTDNALATGIAIHAAINLGSYALVFGTSASSLNYVGTFNASDLTYTDIISGMSIGGYPSSRVVSTGDYYYIATETGICKFNVDGSYETIVSSGTLALRFFGNYTNGQFGSRAGVGGLGVTSGGLLFYTAVSTTSPYGIGLYTYDTTSGDSISLSYSNSSNIQGVTVNGDTPYIASYGSSEFDFEGFSQPYDTGDQVVISSTHRKYQCVSDNVYESPEDGATGTDGATWVDIGATNRWAALDTVINTQTTGSTNQEVSYKFDSVDVFDSFAVFGIENCYQVRVFVIDSDNSTELGRVTISLDNSEPIDDADELVNDALYDSSCIIDGITDLGLSDDSYVSIRFYPVTDKAVSVGSICFGNPRTLGDTTYDTTISIKDYSTYTYDDYGNLTTVARPPADQANFQLMIPDGGYRYTRTVLKALVAETCVWYTWDYENIPFSILGRNTTSTITLNSPKTSSLPLKIEGVI